MINPVIQRCFEISTIYSVILITLYIAKHDSALIPLTFRVHFHKWGELQDLYRKNPTNLTFQSISDSVLLCPKLSENVPQCQCMRDYHNIIYTSDAVNWNVSVNGSLASLGEIHAKAIVSRCLRKRPPYQKDSCGEFCRVHLATPALLMSTFMVLFYSKICRYETYWLCLVVDVIPYVISLTVIAAQLALERTGGIFASLSILSVLLELSYLTPCTSDAQVFWTFQRFFCGVLAVYAATTNQARDMVQVFAFASFGFFVGLLSYIIFLIKQGCPCKYDSRVCLHMWLGVCVITSGLIILGQQAWYPDSPMRSTVISNVCLILACFQSIFLTPNYSAPLILQLGSSFVLLSLCFGAVVLDLL